MGITVGEVEAVLSARDIMSPVMIQAAERVKNLETMLKNLGTTSGGAFDELNTRLTAARENFESLATLNAGAVQAALARTQAGLQQSAVNAQTLTGSLGGLTSASKAASVSVEEVGDKTKATGHTMQGVEGLTMRLIERLIILYAIRGTLQFVVGLYEAADALVKLSSATDMSIQKLQELQIGAAEVGIPFEKVSTAVDTFNKKLAENKIGTEDALESIGLSFSKVFAMKPEERFDAVVHAIAEMPDKLARTKAEVALFGSDAIDPLIKRYDELTKAARDSNKIIGDDTVRSLSMAATAYKGFWESTKAVASSGFAYLIEGFAKVIEKQDEAENKLGIKLTPSPEMIQANISAGAPGDIRIPTGDIKLQADKNVGLVQGTGILQDYIDKLRDAASGERALTDEQIKQMMELKQLNLLTEENAAKLTKDGVNLDINSAKYREFTKLLAEKEAVDRRVQAADEAWAKAMWDLAQAGDGFKGTLEGIDGEVVEAIKYYLAAGVSQANLAKAYELTEVQVKAVAASLKEEAAAAKHAADVELQITRLRDEEAALRVRLSGSSTEVLIANEKRISDNQAAQMKKRGEDTAEYEAERARRDSLAIEVIIHNHELLDKNSRASFQQRYDDSLAEYQFKVSHSDQYTRADIENSKKRMEQARLELQQWREFADSGTSGFKSLAEAGVKAGDTIIDSMGRTTTAVQLLSGRIVALSDIMKGFVTGWFDEKGKEVTSITSDRYSGEQFATAATRIGNGVTAAELKTMVTAGYGSLESLVQAAMDAFKEAASGIKKSVPDDAISRWIALGGRVPGFADGGTIKVGERGPELITIHPSGTGGVGGAGGAMVRFEAGAIQINYPIMNDARSKDELLNHLSDAIVDRLRPLMVRYPHIN